jgi:hypothetical protein
VLASGEFAEIETQWQHWVGLPGWQVVFGAIDPVVLFAINQQLIPAAAAGEELLLLIDRAVTDWDEYKYFIVDRAGQLAVEWFESQPSAPLLGQLILVLRPKRMLATGNQHDLWEMEE